jgi:hypothetical protein
VEALSPSATATAETERHHEKKKTTTDKETMRSMWVGWSVVDTVIENAISRYSAFETFFIQKKSLLRRICTEHPFCLL